MCHISTSKDNESHEASLATIMLELLKKSEIAELYTGDVGEREMLEN